MMIDHEITRLMLKKSLGALIAFEICNTFGQKCHSNEVISNIRPLNVRFDLKSRTNLT